MASKDKRVTSSLIDREKALLNGRMPGQAAQMSDSASHRRERAPRRKGLGEFGLNDRARMFGDAGVNADLPKTRRERSPEPQDTAPTVGKTGGRGHKAEKPSEGSDRRQARRPPVEVTRTSKPPAETPNSRSSRGSAKPQAASAPGR
jgi:hypothetical protein